MKTFALAAVVMVALWGGLVTVYDDAGRAHVLQVNETGGVGRAWMVHDITTGRSWTVEADSGLADDYPPTAPTHRSSIREDFPDLWFVDEFK